MPFQKANEGYLKVSGKCPFCQKTVKKHMQFPATSGQAVCECGAEMLIAGNVEWYGVKANE